MKLILATHNKNKLRELKEILAPFNIEVHDLHYINVDELKDEETGLTYKDNAYIKAHEASTYTKEIVLADDSGIEIEALDNNPGVKTARYAENLGGYDKAIETILRACEKKNNYSATFTCSLCVMNLIDKPLHFEARIPGTVSKDINGTHGFGFDPIFISDEVGIPNAYLEPEVKNKYSARGKALQMFINYLKENNYI